MERMKIMSKTEVDKFIFACAIACRGNWTRRAVTESYKPVPKCPDCGGETYFKCRMTVLEEEEEGKDEN